MRDDLLLYYERELTYIRQLAAEFAEKYPKVASRLVLERDKCEDPHVERLLEGFAFLAARVHLKIDDEFPEITESLLQIVYPNYIRPVPSMSVVEFQLDPDSGKLTTGLKIDRHSMLYSKPVGGVPCKFRTCYDTTVWPIKVTAAEWKTPDRLRPAVRASDSVAAVRLELRCGPDTVFPALEMDELTFYLSGEGALVFKFYELLASRLTRILIRDPRPGSQVPTIALDASQLVPLGFEEDELLMPHVRRSFVGYALLHEYFTFPEKFLFFKLKGLREVWEAGFEGSAEIIFLFSRFEGEGRREILESGISPQMFRLSCTPIVNLFPQTAEPLLLDQKKYEYSVIPDIRRMNATEVFSIDEVTSYNSSTQEAVKFLPFYSFHQGIADNRYRAFWIASRRPSSRRNDIGTDMYISLLDLSMRTVHPDTDSLTIRTTCTNRDLPARLPFGAESGDFDLENNGPIERIISLVKPTMPLRPPTGKDVQWRLISQLSLNYLSLVSEGREALQQVLALHNFTGSAFARKMIDGIIRVESKRHFARMLSEYGVHFARGTRVEIEFDEEQFVGGGVYLFASVLEQFLGHYVHVNGFSQLAASTKQRKEILREWPPRAGRQILV
jgi:type VI secretion system protein ImpG